MKTLKIFAVSLSALLVLAGCGANQAASSHMSQEIASQSLAEASSEAPAASQAAPSQAAAQAPAAASQAPASEAAAPAMSTCASCRTAIYIPATSL